MPAALTRTGPLCLTGSRLFACSWYRYVTEDDLLFFKDHMERNVPVDGASNWEPMMNRDFGTFTYTAWRRILPVSLCLTLIVIVTGHTMAIVLDVVLCRVMYLSRRQRCSRSTTPRHCVSNGRGCVAMRLAG